MKTGTYANASTTAAVAVSTSTFTLKSSVAVGLLLVLGSMPVRLNAQAATQFVPFDSFLEQTKATVKLESLKPGSRVTDTAALDQMRQHILTMYTGVQVVRSFVRDTDHYDCMPVAKQPTVQILGLQSIADAPPKALLAAHNQNPGNDAGALAANAGSQQPDADTDSFGNPTSCDAGTVPVRRLTLDEMAQFPTLKDFFQKKPGAQGVPGAPGSIKGGATDTDHKDWLAAVAKPTTGSLSHKYSYTYSWVNNLGGNAALNLWSPYVNTGLGEVFSLSQEWYVGGSGYGTQTAEVGWQNYPAKYGNEAARLFIYYTADDYNSTGCYNLDCGAFVQVSNSAYLGGSWGAYSTPGGPQYEFSAEFYLYNGNWWLAIQGNWIGYYPGYIYHGGQMSRYAQLIEFGTESVGSTVYPPEGSGYWPAAGWSYAAYQRNLYYINTNGVTAWDGLTPVDPSPACYNIYGPLSSPSSGWSIYFFEGGPGGRGC